MSVSPEVLESKTTPGCGIEHNQLEVRATRAVSGDQFAKGVIDYPFTIGGSWAFVPNRCYFRVGLKLVGGGGTDPIKSENIAFADNVCGNMFNNCYFRAGQQDVSSIVSYLPQASQLKNRITKSGAWTRTVGKSAYGQDPSFASRINTVSVEGVQVGAMRETIKLNDADDITMSVDGATGAITLGGTAYANVAPYAIAVGDILVIDGLRFEVKAAGDAAGAGMIVSPPPTTTIAATSNVVLLTTEKTPQASTVYFHWTPPVGIFDSARPMGSGDYRVSLNPQANYKRAIVQALEALTPGAEYDVEVEDMSFFVSLVRVNVPATMSEKLELTEIQIQTKAATDAKNNQLDFTVPPSTYAIAVYVQSGSSGSTTALPPSVFKTLDKSDENLKHIQLTYANVSKPSTNWSSEYVPGSKNYLTQRYMDTQSETGMIFNPGGTETFSEWLERGPYVFYRFLRDRSDRSTHLTVNCEFDNLTAAGTVNLHVVALYRRVVSITTTSGRVSSVETLSV